ncbi:MAG: hypothetical protein F6K09_38790, partial [Merismopedia sp. SIO2A8]|nr:hypothetical protein [Merismopedia sp. SIO2A8]
LQENALAYGFELSFHGEEDSVVSYEPWHWRFVGDRHSLETFYGEGQSLPSQPVGDRTSENQESSDEQPDS